MDDASSGIVVDGDGEISDKVVDIVSSGIVVNGDSDIATVLLSDGFPTGGFVPSGAVAVTNPVGVSSAEAIVGCTIGVIFVDVDDIGDTGATVDCAPVAGSAAVVCVGEE